MNRLIVIFFYIFSILHTLFGEKDFLLFLRLAQFSGLIAFLMVMNQKGGNLFKSKSIIRLTGYKIPFLAIAGTIIIGLLNLRLNITPIIYPISFISVSLLTILSKPKLNIFIFLSFLVFLLFFYYALTGVDISLWVKGSSNYVSVLVLYISFVPLLIHKINKGGVNLILNIIFPMLALSFSIIAIGRSGIIVSTIFFLGNLTLYVRNHKHKFMILSIFIIFFAFSFSKLYSFIDFITNDYLFKLINKGATSEVRKDIVDYYFSKINFRTLLFSIDNLDLDKQMGVTLHNSYLSWHYKYGFFSFVIFYMTILTFFKSLKTDKVLSIILIVILIRSFTDLILLTEGILFGFPFILALLLVDYKNLPILKLKK